MQDNIPKSDVNREYYQQNSESALAKTGGTSESVLIIQSLFNLFDNFQEDIM